MRTKVYLIGKLENIPQHLGEESVEAGEDSAEIIQLCMEREFHI